MTDQNELFDTSMIEQTESLVLENLNKKPEKEDKKKEAYEMEKIPELFDSEIDHHKSIFETIEKNEVANQLDDLFGEQKSAERIVDFVRENRTLNLNFKYQVIDSNTDRVVTLPKPNGNSKFTIRAINGNTLHKIISKGALFSNKMDYFMLPSDLSYKFVYNVSNNTWYIF